jgi:ribosome-associated translation inhibitor RaiA
MERGRATTLGDARAARAFVRACGAAGEPFTKAWHDMAGAKQAGGRSGRGRGRRRAAMLPPRAVLKAAKRTAGRARGPAEIPAYIRALGVKIDDGDRAYVRQKLATKLAKFASSVERVSVRVRDVNGPRGGVDQACRVKVVLSGLPSVVVEHQDASLRAATDAALVAVERAVRRAVQRRRTKPLRRAG